MKSLWILSVCLIVSGCSRGVDIVFKADPAAVVDEEALDKITTHKGLEKRVRVDSAYLSVRDGLLVVQINMVNRTNNEQEFRYLMEWFDPDGIQIYDSTSVWIRKKVEPRQRINIALVATDPKAVDWRLTLQDWEN